MTMLPLGLLFQSLVGAAYQFPPGLTVAPGQVIPLLVTGLKTVVPGKLQAQEVPLPTNLAGISVTLQQTLPDRSWQLPIFAIQQADNCAGLHSSPSCLMTAITVQIPYDISVPLRLLCLCPQPYTSVTIMENGAVSQSFQASLVFDRVHILQSCDIGGSGFESGACWPLITHSDGTLVQQDLRSGSGKQTHTEAVAGETLVMYAYGLGTVTTPVTAGTPSPIPAATAAEEFYLRFDYSPDAGPSIPELSEAPLAVYNPYLHHPVFVGLTPGQVGLYQINIVVPPPPAGTQPCGVLGASNLTISVLATGSLSFDGAGICVDPGAGSR